ncbi:MAG: hypothetical protein R3350_06245, partial [Saprospiraceae bacterium]|nr:hypothetical protein [Saprospiraceae bacterium]
DVEQGRVDMAINRFDTLPQSFHQKTLWSDSFSCLMSPDNVLVSNFNLDAFENKLFDFFSSPGMGLILASVVILCVGFWLFFLLGTLRMGWGLLSYPQAGESMEAAISRRSLPKNLIPRVKLDLPEFSLGAADLALIDDAFQESPESDPDRIVTPQRPVSEDRQNEQ